MDKPFMFYAMEMEGDIDTRFGRLNAVAHDIANCVNRGMTPDEQQIFRSHSFYSITNEDIAYVQDRVNELL